MELCKQSSSKHIKIQTRSMIKAEERRKPNAALIEAKKKAKHLKLLNEQIVDPIKDVFQNVSIQSILQHLLKNIYIGI